MFSSCPPQLFSHFHRNAFRQFSKPGKVGHFGVDFPLSRYAHRKDLHLHLLVPGPELRMVASAYLKLILQYCHRIYSRQQDESGLPTVAWCATQFSITPGYFEDIIRRHTGKTAISYIHAYIIQKGKNLMLNGSNIYETSALLGFEYPNHFSRLFKKMEGITPTKFLKG